MSRQQSEGEVHVAAMRLILAAMERSEDPPDWTIWQHMLSMLETIFQGIEDQRRDDQDELFHTRQDLADAHTVDFNLRRQLDAAEAALTRERLDAEERSRELERLWAFVEVMRGLLTEEYADQRIIAEALAELDDAEERNELNSRQQKGGE